MAPHVREDGLRIVVEGGRIRVELAGEGHG
jgi:hypothetical protein